ncbi:hypothetical protein F0U60_31650 [Archangium minus]|uniref:Uncharacterized protein n=1 Tax=Archangium minus TaxID=83450 RepID=A0ABY9WYG7_9BACT|nr:hypothetical protein F0U60_31650 [Archangium minus]
MSTSIDNTSWTLAADWPVVALPVRLETRFTATGLRIRVFPDTVHIDSHEPRLTDAEVEAGKRYWEATWRAAGNTGRWRAAWEQLTTMLGTARATWVARVTEPNPAGKPTEEIPESAPLPVAPDFPEPLRTPSVWTRPPYARGLPTRWHVVAIRNTGAGTVRVHEVFGQPIRRPLAVGPAPDFDPATLPDEDAPVGPAMRWLVDYNEAVAAGMAHTLELPAELRDRIDRLLVFGVDDTLTPQETADVLNRLMEAHGATDGLGLLPPGAPTNNTTSARGAVRSAHDPRAPENIQALQVAHGEQAPGAATAVVNQALRALGLPASMTAGQSGPVGEVRGRPVPEGAPTALPRQPGAARDPEADIERVHSALWPTTWGYFLRHMMSGRFGTAVADRMREQFVRLVRADGPLPTLRIGAQPYGLLPVLAMNGWGPVSGESDDTGGVALLRRLRDQVWGPSVDDVSTIPPTGGQAPAEALLDIFGSDAHIREFRARSVLGNEYVAWLWRFARLRLGDTWQVQLSARSRSFLQSLGLLGAGERVPVAAGTVFAADAFRLGTPLVAAPGTSPASYLSALATATATSLRGLPEQPDPSPAGVTGGVPVLYRLLRTALLAEYSRAAERLGAPEPVEPELIDIAPDTLTSTLWRRLDTPLPGGNGQTIGAYLDSTAGVTDARAEGLRALREAISRFAALPVAELERYVSGALGLTAHRLDAWFTSYATRRLWTMRSARPAGAWVGGFGWLLNLERGPTPATIDSPWPELEPGKLRLSSTGAGFVHAPSVPQALTAAVLRSGWRSYGGPVSDNPLAVDLSSRRVKIAEFLLDGVRQGQQLGALLGYRFERALHEHPYGTLGAYLPAFRALAPLRATLVTAHAAPRGTETTTATTDGLVLHDKAKAGLAWGRDGLPETTHPAYGPLREVLTELADAVDAVSDALLAESVHHLVNGNPARAGASLEAASRGTAVPPELEFARGGRTGSAVTHRVVVLANVTRASRAQWPAESDRSPRMLLSTVADVLASALLPEPSRVFCRAHWHLPDGGLEPVSISLDFLSLPAIDYVMMAPREPVPNGAELDQLLDRAFRARLPADEAARRAGWRLALDFGRDAGWSFERLSVAEFLGALDAVRALLTGTRALTPTDLSAPGSTVGYVGVDQELVNAADGAAIIARNTVTELRGSNPADVDRALLRASNLGVMGVIPPPAGASTDPATVARRTEAVERAIGELTQRLATAEALVAGFNRTKASPDELREHDLARLRAVAGTDLPFLPALMPVDAAGWESALAASPALQGGDPGAVGRWMAQYARVRPAVERLQQTLTFAQALRTGLATSPGEPLQVAQYPAVAGDRWWGLPRPASAPATSRTGWVVCMPQKIDWSRAVAGLAVDEWTEVVPSLSETTGVAFEYDAPGAVAPQSILVAVPSRPDAAWTAETLEQTLNETLDLARIRAVDLDTLGDAGQFLPAIYFPYNVARHAASTDLVPDAAPTTARALDAERP